jgi:HD superfamily phosphohydrolase
LKYIILFILTASLFSSIPQTLSYQGYLIENDSDRINGTVKMTFSLHDEEDGAEKLWSESREVKVEDGFYSLILGEENPINIDFNSQYWLSLKIEDKEELKPRQKLTSVAYSLNSIELERVLSEKINNLEKNISREKDLFEDNISTNNLILEKSISKKMTTEKFDKNLDGKIEHNNFDINNSLIFNSREINASGQMSLAWGYQTEASKDYATAWG